MDGFSDSAYFFCWGELVVGFTGGLQISLVSTESTMVGLSRGKKSRMLGILVWFVNLGHLIGVDRCGGLQK